MVTKEVIVNAAEIHRVGHDGSKGEQEHGNGNKDRAEATDSRVDGLTCKDVVVTADILYYLTTIRAYHIIAVCDKNQYGRTIISEVDKQIHREINTENA